MDVRIIHFYPDLMSLYGSRANVLALERLLAALGCAVTVEKVVPGGRADLGQADFIYMGAGTERAARAAMEDLGRFDLKSAAGDGAVMLFAGTAMDLLGSTIREADGGAYDGVGLASYTTEHGKRRIVEDVYAHTDLFPEAVVGFMNKCGLVKGVETPLLTRLDLGFGNEAEHGPEGYVSGNVFGTHLTGPVLVKNPQMLDFFVRRLFAVKGWVCPEALPELPHQRAAYEVTLRELRARI